MGTISVNTGYDTRTMRLSYEAQDALRDLLDLGLPTERGQEDAIDPEIILDRMDAALKKAERQRRVIVNRTRNLDVYNLERLEDLALAAQHRTNVIWR